MTPNAGTSTKGTTVVYLLSTSHLVSHNSVLFVSNSPLSEHVLIQGEACITGVLHSAMVPFHPDLCVTPHIKQEPCAEDFLE